MRGPKLCLAVVLPLLAVAGAVVGPDPAVAQPATCPASDEDPVSVVIVSPEDGADVSGRVEVSGRAESPTPLFQVELFVGDSRKDLVVVDPPATATDFALAWDTSAATAGPATLRVVACGGIADAGQLVRGTASVDVQVAASPPAPARALVEVRPDDDGGASREPSVTAGAVIAIPAAICFLFALGRRRPS